MTRAVPLLVLDLDGTVRQGKDDALGRFVNGPGDVVVFPEAVARMQEWKDAGGRIVAATNQGGVALKHLTMKDMRDALIATHMQANYLFDKIVACVHHPDAPNPEFARCWCRKPRPGLVVEGAILLGQEFKEAYPPHLGLFVGDRSEDEECARNLNMDFMHAHVWRAGGDEWKQQLIKSFGEIE